MAASVLLMCKYGEVTLVVMVTKGFGFNDLVQSICNKWENLASSKFGLLYAVADHHSCVLDNDEDFGCMIALAAAYGVNCIDVSVGIISSSVIECGKSLATQNGECGGSFEYGVEMANKELFGDFELSFDKLRWYAAEVKEKNPSTVMDVEYCTETGHFTRFFLAFDACIRGFNYCRPILALDVFPNGFHSYCLQHLKGNLRDKISGRLSNGFRENLVNMFNDVAHAPTVLTFKKALDELCTIGGASVKNFVESLPVENWANAYFKGKRYGEMTSNAAESFNNQILKFRHLPICDLVDKVRVLLMEQMCERKQLSSKWNSSVCPVMDKKLIARFDKGRTWHVAAASDDIFEVYSLPTVVVDLKRMTWTCCRWELHCFPCVHAFTVIQKTERQLYNYINPYYTVAAFQLSYEVAINPIPTLGAPVGYKRVCDHSSSQNKEATWEA
ncbi:hypothetical protein RHGRI_017271 [Rhododendron griersonianum]|uniref:SWIM-type domain-containing protein n=1 Tax=Rhododendron griersonianum TaxID=479676 RepID=A0AAV6JX86_9ERIC|nr:hypothetical protein RHGRI_017271 [Rhododendron griersonianum]